MLKIHLFSIFTIKTQWALTREDTDTCTLTITNLVSGFNTSLSMVVMEFTVNLYWLKGSKAWVNKVVTYNQEEYISI